MRAIRTGDLSWRLKEFLPSGWVRDDIAAAALADEAGWIPASVPGSVQRSVIAAGLAPDPFRERNSLACEWMADRTWVYHARFDADRPTGGERIRLSVAGVDYAARFILNGVELGRHEGMSTGVVFDVTDATTFDRENDLVVVLAPAPWEQDQLGRTSLVRSRKSRMGYWWDFCPRLIDLGITGKVALATGSLFVDELELDPVLAPDRRSAVLGVSVKVSGPVTSTVEVDVEVDVSRNGTIVCVQRARVGDDGRAAVLLSIAEPELWWPNGHGAQALYDVVVRVGDEVELGRTVGFRSIELAPNDDAEAGAPPYVFVVNGRRIYVNGWNWVPVDALYADPRPEKVRHLLRLAARAHANLVRVNGVGRIETDQFYEECDRLGLMVWQEFLLTSSATDRKPSEDRQYLDAVVQEACAIVPRVAHHASLVLWCAGNELEGLDRLPLDDAEPVIGALKDVAARLDHDAAWLPTSARGRKPFNGPNSIREDPGGLHDVHGPWQYQGLQAQYELYNAGTSLFHSEIGAEAITNPETARAVLDEREWSVHELGSPAWRHLSAWWVRPEQWAEYFGPVEDLDRLVAATQFLQAEGVRYAIESNRRRAFRNSGSLPWQFNEPFPMLGSTAAVDYYGRPKQLYTAVRQAYAPLALSAAYDRIAWGGHPIARFRLWAASSLTEARSGRFVATAFDGTGRILGRLELDVVVPASGAVKLTDFAVAMTDAGCGLFLLDLAFTDGAGSTATRRMLFSSEQTLAPLAALQETELTTEPMADGSRLEVRNAGPVVAPVVRIHDAREPGAAGWLVPSDDHVMLLPGESRQIGLTWRGVPERERRVAVSGLNVRTARLAAVGG
jgi:beta-mannosidase